MLCAATISTETKQGYLKGGGFQPQVCGKSGRQEEKRGGKRRVWQANRQAKQVSGATQTRLENPFPKRKNELYVLKKRERI
jgi:hypothetical protein